MKYFVIPILFFLLISCSKEEEKIEEIPEITVYATQIFLNTNFYENTFPIFEKLFKCRIKLISFSNVEKLLKQNSQKKADLLLGLDNTWKYKIIADSILVSYQPANLKKVNDKLIFDKEHFIIPIYYSPLAFIYKKGELENVPKTFGAIQDGKLKDKIILTNVETSSIGRAALIWSVSAFKASGYRHFWRSIKNNIYQIVENQNVAYNMLLAGEAPIIIGYQTTPLNEENFGSDYSAVIPQEGGFNLIFGVGISRNSQNLKLSHNFVDFLLSDLFQSLVQTEITMLPVSTDIILQKEFSELQKVNKNLTNELSDKMLNENLNNWLKKWQKIMQ